MALARVVTFDGVSADHMQQLRRRIEAEDGPPEGMPASELLILHNPDGGKATAIVIFDSEEDYAKGDAILGAMPASETPGTRTSVTKCEVALRMQPVS